MACEVAELVKGEKVLVQFHQYPVIPLAQLKDKPTPEQYAAGKTAVHDRVAAALKAAGIDVACIPYETRGSEMGLTYSAMWLLDCNGKDPQAALKDVPYHCAGIVFQDGNYQRGLPADASPKIPARYAFRQWGTGNPAQFREENERWPKLDQVVIEKLPLPGGGAGAGGSMGGVILRPARGHTLLEVFILTGAGFQLVDP